MYCCIDMMHFYQVINFNKSFYFACRNPDPNKALEKYEKMYNAYLRQKAKGKGVWKEVYELLAGDEYAILFLYSTNNDYTHDEIVRLVMCDYSSVNIL
jgi:hypothetical protein